MKSEQTTPHNLHDVFTPASADPSLNFVARGGTEDDLNHYLDTQGRPICVERPFRCGKTSLVLRSVRTRYKRIVHVVCNNATTFDELLSRALDELAPVVSLVVESKEIKTKPGFKGAFGVEVDLGGGSKETLETMTPVLQPQLTSASVARFMVEADAAWVIDDAHKLTEPEFRKVACAMREWQTMTFPGGYPKMIVVASDIGAPSATHRLIDGAPDLTTRLARLGLSLMSDSELSQIIKRGEDLLNIDLSAIHHSVLQYSFGFPGICHDLCLQACRAAKITRTADNKVTLNSAHLQQGLKKYVDEYAHSIKDSFEKVRDALSQSVSPAFYSYVLGKVASRSVGEGIGLKVLSSEVEANLGLSQEVVASGIQQFFSEDSGVLRFEPTTKVVLFREPLYRAFYIQQSAAESDEIEREELASAFLRVLSNEE